mgnify:CR=1 FL=1
MKVFEGQKVQEIVSFGFPAKVNICVLAQQPSKCNRLTHCSKSSFFVQKFNFDFPRKLSNFLGKKLVKMLWF